MQDTISICSYNLHGYHDKSTDRYAKIAYALSQYQPDICLLQEVIRDDSGNDIASLIAEYLTKILNTKYHSLFTCCHLFMDRYPEGVAIISKYCMHSSQVIDLNTDLKYSAKSSMPRFAPIAMVDISGKKIAVSSIHLDYNPNPIVRLAQAEKLVNIFLKNYYDVDAIILAGDFNDVQHSPVISYIRSMGFRDALWSVGNIEDKTYSTENPHCRIDYIFVKGFVDVLDAKVILHTPAYSDHFGLWCLLQT